VSHSSNIDHHRHNHLPQFFDPTRRGGSGTPRRDRQRPAAGGGGERGDVSPPTSYSSEASSIEMAFDGDGARHSHSQGDRHREDSRDDDDDDGEGSGSGGEFDRADMFGADEDDENGDDDAMMRRGSFVLQ
jgi:hypothetical protein